MLFRLAIVLLLTAAQSCAPQSAGPVCGTTSTGTDGETGAVSEPLIYGDDTRREPYETENPTIRAVAEQSTVALVSSHRLHAAPDGLVRLDTLPLRERLAHGEEPINLCPGTPFEYQPTSPHCSGTLIDDDLVVTAGHCVRSRDQCLSTRFVFNFRLEPSGEIHPIAREDVFGCRDLLAVAQREDDAALVLDYAVVELDRPATPRFAPIRQYAGAEPLVHGQSTVLIGHPNGMPSKVDVAGRVVSPRSLTLDYFTATVDAFAGNSGSGIFTPEGVLIGLLVSGGQDYVETGCGCDRPNWVGDKVNRPGAKGERATYFFRAVEVLCASGWPSPVCGRAYLCGDGFCSGPETHENCQEDCSTAQCGNGACEEGEDGFCETDCRVFTGSLPSGWLQCSPASYDADDGCDCGCGAPDPDCLDPTQPVRNCEPGQTCSILGSCQGDTTTDPGTTPSGPTGWTCDADWYGAQDGCDCDCGTRDTDCDLAGQTLYRCNDGEVCNASGDCEPGSGTTGAGTGGGSSPPTSWTCDADWWDSRDGCDCDCGARDPDCDVTGQSLYRCDGGTCDANGNCILS